MLSKAERTAFLEELYHNKEILTPTQREKIVENYFSLGHEELWDAGFSSGRLSEYQFYKLKASRLYRNKITGV